MRLKFVGELLFAMLNWPKEHMMVSAFDHELKVYFYTSR